VQWLLSSGCLSDLLGKTLVRAVHPFGGAEKYSVDSVSSYGVCFGERSELEGLLFCRIGLSLCMTVVDAIPSGGDVADAMMFVGGFVCCVALFGV